jgi:hypothetical protein
MRKQYIAISDDMIWLLGKFVSECIDTMNDQMEESNHPIERIGLKTAIQEATELLTELKLKTDESNNRLSSRETPVQPMGGVYPQTSEKPKPERAKTVYVKSTTRPQRS